MQRAKELTEAEKAALFDEIVKIHLDGQNKPILEQYKGSSRAAQTGHQTLMLLFRNGVIKPGDAQERMSL